MKRKELLKRCLLALCLSVSLVSSSVAVCYGAPERGTSSEGASASESDTKEEERESENRDTEAESKEESDADILEIGSLEAFLEFAENCKYDSYSLGRTVSLTTDLDLSGADFDGIAYFNGIFAGNGHEIVNAEITAKGSDYGFFRYIGESGEVKDLNVSGNIKPSGSQENIGGLVGVNYGTVTNCSFEGTVNGLNSVGAIAGINKSTGKIITAASDATVLATNYTGGIAGTNEGLITGCLNKSSINTEELEPTLDLGGVDLSSLNLTQNVINRNDMGGIAGYSTGMIVDCKNEGLIGYKHTGYNAGGIVGRQSGIVLTSTNEGKVYGRKDVGGIVGQAEPYIESEYLEDKVAETKEDIDRLSNTLNNISSTISATSTKAKTYVDSLSNQYTTSMSTISGNINALSDSIGREYPEAQGYVDNINKALANIQSIQESGQELSEEQLNAINSNLGIISDNLSALQSILPESAGSAQELLNQITSQIKNGNTQSSIQELAASISREMEYIQNYLGAVGDQAGDINENAETIHDNLADLQGSFSGTEQAAGNLAGSISNQMNDTSARQDMQNLADTLDSGMQSITNGMNSVADQMNEIADSVSEDIGVLMGEEEIVEDISSLATSENTDGVISGCANRGEINGDLNVGGIVGTMNVEYEGDPEFDLDLTESVNITLRSTVNAVVLNSVNYGSVTAKKNCAGGITGLQELGFIYGCEGYGHVRSDSGNYLGGIVGDSAGTIEKSYSLCNVSGTDYVGGICGNGYSVKDSISVSDIDGSGEWIGSIAGNLETEGTVQGNLFVSDKIHGIDDISYAGVADRVSYEELMEREDIPEGFKRVTIVFETEDGILEETEIAYGGSVSSADYPKVPEKEGCYVEWPKEETLKDVKKNLTITAEYIPWVESVASSGETEAGKPVLLVAGEFYKDTKLTLEASGGPEELDNEAVLAYAYSWKLSGEREKEFETLEAHFAVPEGAERVSVWVQKDGSWAEAEAKEDGSYVVADLPYGAAFAVVTQPTADHSYLIVIGVAALLVVVLIVWRYRKNKAGKTAGKK